MRYCDTDPIALAGKAPKVLNLVSCNALQIRHLGTSFNLDWSSDLLYFSNGLYTHGGGTATMCLPYAALRNLLRLHRARLCCCQLTQTRS
jgi:hypothetical protein